MARRVGRGSEQGHCTKYHVHMSIIQLRNTLCRNSCFVTIAALGCFGVLWDALGRFGTLWGTLGMLGWPLLDQGVGGLGGQVGKRLAGCKNVKALDCQTARRVLVGTLRGLRSIRVLRRIGSWTAVLMINPGM